MNLPPVLLSQCIENVSRSDLGEGAFVIVCSATFSTCIGKDTNLVKIVQSERNSVRGPCDWSKSGLMQPRRILFVSRDCCVLVLEL